MGKALLWVKLCPVKISVEVLSPVPGNRVDVLSYTVVILEVGSPWSNMTGVLIKRGESEH